MTGWIRLLLASFWLVWMAAPALAQRPVSDGDRPRWEELKSCRLQKSAYADGDSFRLEYQGREYVFRLYLVDAPETHLTFPDRVEEQAASFGIGTADVIRLGQEAQDFSARRLASGCTVLTRWQNAQGMGTLPRFYGAVFIDSSNLGVELVRNGYARIHGTNLAGIEKDRAASWLEELRAAERDARVHQRGGWDPRRYPRLSGSGSPAVPTPRTKIELNSATRTELMKLPGIGPKLADRIMAERPYGSVADLIRVQGIGPKTLESLTNLVTVRPAGGARTKVP